MERLKLMIVAGEASGDGHAAKLVRAFREASPNTEFEFFGAAGEKMRQAGVEAVVESDHFSIVGLAEIGGALPMFLRAFRKLKAAALKSNPDAVILVDFPDFNLKLAKSLSKQGMKIIYYISPQIWAWRKYRIRTIRKYVDLVITILPFEKDWYEQEGVTHVEYVGSPLAKEVFSSVPKIDFCKKHGLDPDRMIVTFLPGSRHKEIVRILPVMLDAAAAVSESDPKIQFIVAMASERDRDLADQIIKTTPQTGTLKVISGETYEALNASDAAAITSGTATLEAGIIGTPMAIVYKTSALNYGLMEPIISVEHYGLINLIAGKRLAKELIQRDFTSRTLSAELLRLLNPQVNKQMRDDLRNAADKLGRGGASMRAAHAILAKIS